LFGESIGSSADISLTLIGLRIHWPTLTIIRCWWSCNRLQYLKLCASSLFFSSLSWHLVALEEMDWLSSVMILSRIPCTSCSCMYCSLQDVLETRKFVIRNFKQRLWSRCSAGRFDDFWKQLSLLIVQIQYNYDRAVTLMLLLYFFASLRKVNARHRW